MSEIKPYTSECGRFQVQHMLGYGGPLSIVCRNFTPAEVKP